MPQPVFDARTIPGCLSTVVGPELSVNSAGVCCWGECLHRLFRVAGWVVWVAFTDFAPSAELWMRDECSCSGKPARGGQGWEVLGGIPRALIRTPVPQLPSLFPKPHLEAALTLCCSTGGKGRDLPGHTRVLRSLCQCRRCLNQEGWVLLYTRSVAAVGCGCQGAEAAPGALTGAISGSGTSERTRHQAFLTGSL